MGKRPAGAPWYLLLLDDLCETFDLVHLARLAKGICAEGVRPVAAIIPDNRDTVLHIREGIRLPGEPGLGGKGSLDG